MQVATRRLIIVGAISLLGASAGIALGNFVAAGPKLTGLEELASYGSALGMSREEAAKADPDPGFAARNGPVRYDCTGCDASPYNDLLGVDVAAAAMEPLPPYESADTPLPVARPDVTGALPRRGPPPGSVTPSALLASPAPIGVASAPVAAPALPQTVAAQ